MKVAVGIDLGSTTTKAVVLDEEGHIRGRGITNSRSNYDVACEVARTEALLDARFNLFADRLDAHARLSVSKENLLGALRSNFRLEQHLLQLKGLEEACCMNADRLAERMGDASSRLCEAVERIFIGMRERAHNHFASRSRAETDFFRDMAGSNYMSLAQWLAKQLDLEFEQLLGIYDKSILSVENHVPTTFLHDLIEHALQRTLQQERAADPVRRMLQRDVRAVVDSPLTEVVTVGTGYGRARLPFPKEHIRSEILCHGLGAHATFAETRTVLDIGGQDTKAIQGDEHGIVTSFQMNDRCAAGCGRYLGYIADEMNLGLHELGPLAMEAKRAIKINSTCTVFAGAELRDRLATGQRREDILLGLHRAIILRAMSLLARSGGVHDEFTFTGGVAKNEAAVHALRELVEENYGERKINISSDSIYTGALGAAIFALRSSREGDGAEAGAEAALAGGAA